ncbi:sulfate/molybdate ABC transporter ATP-binding protein [Arachnia propionica]|uniref:ABC transporter ATP-binding protein n=1 Tax=Arachnia propionica TaxID=1750 RepID=A0A3P1WYT1_9ACTN|nr:ABC transporter ATP-binding protein [Arachnia propionica]RRD51345.1 ABC transporter ATP-binding protein [Arachnia propionica]
MGDLLCLDASVRERDVSVRLHVPEGRTLAVVGPNGAGKSTLLDLIAGVLRPSSGTVRLRGEEVSGPHRHLLPYRRRISYVEQRALLFPHLDVLGNVTFGPRSRGVPAKVARQRALDELAAVNCLDLAGCRATELSGGQAQRVAVARALAVDPDIVLLDEPFAALDATVTPELRQLLRARLVGQTAILVTHDLVDVVALADHVVELARGRVVADGPVDELVQAPSTPFLADFVGMNLLHGQGEGKRVRLDATTVITGMGEVTAGPARAVFSPSAVGLFEEAPHGSPRNQLAARVVGVEDRPFGQRISLEVCGQRFAADITAAAAAELGIVEGMSLVAVVKASEVTLHPGGGGQLNDVPWRPVP